MAVKFCPIASGSSGNSTFISTGNTNILIDAGLSGKRISLGLSAIGEGACDIDAILVTHEHVDHIQGAAVLSRKYNIPIYATQGTWEQMSKLDSFSKIEACNRKYIYIGENMILNDLCIRPFAIPHDAAEPVGYSVVSGSFKISVSTDIGRMTDDITENIKDSDILFIESNHDVDMLVNGIYPYYLKKRVLSDCGHLSNVDCGQTIKGIYNERLKHVYLGHLSEENNRPELAYETVYNILAADGVCFDKLSLCVANRSETSRLVTL